MYITEEDGEVDRDFPALDSKECVAKFGFTCLGLVEHKNGKNVSFEAAETIPLFKEEEEENDKTNCKFAPLLLLAVNGTSCFQ